jgi:hypothetical protein
VVVPELHKSGRYHFHGVFSNCEGMTFKESGHYSDSGKEIYHVGNYRLGFTTATKVGESIKSAMYMGKYITKELCGHIRGKKRYWKSRNCNMPEEEKYLDEDVKGTKEMLHDLCKKEKEVVTYLLDNNGNNETNVIFEM